MDIQTALGLEDGSPVDITAVISSVQDARRGETNGRSWCILPCKIKDETGEVVLSWFNPPTTNWKDIKGKTVSIKATDDQGATMTTYNGANGAVRQVKVFADNIELVGGFTNSGTGASGTGDVRPLYTPSALTENDILAAIDRWWTRFETRAGIDSDRTGIAAMVNTLVIAATNGKITLDPATTTSTFDDDIPF